jgi:hypothetical protein
MGEMWIELVTLTYERRKSNIQEFGLDHVLHYRPIQVIDKINYYSQFIHDIHYTIHIQTMTQY